MAHFIKIESSKGAETATMFEMQFLFHEIDVEVWMKYYDIL